MLIKLNPRGVGLAASGSSKPQDLPKKQKRRVLNDIRVYT